MHDSALPRIKLDDLQSDYPGVFDVARSVDAGIGWLRLIDDFVESALLQDPSLTVLEIRQKLGSLDIRIDNPSPGVLTAHRLAEARSYHVCEYCGQSGVWSSRRGYLTTVCENHAVVDGYRAEPVESELYTYRDDAGVWHRYDPDDDAFIPTEAPDWAR